VATSVGITSAVLIERGVLEHRASRTILGAAIVDDILAMILLAVAGGIAGSRLDPWSIAVTVLLALGFVAFFALGGTRLTARRPGIFHTPRFSESPLLPAVIACLGLAALASAIGLAAIIGAFLAGMIVAETRDHHPIEEEVVPLYAFFPPFFFASSGWTSTSLRSPTSTRCCSLPLSPCSRWSPSSLARGSAPGRSDQRRRGLSPWAWSRVARSGSSSPASAARWP
jgi:Kef-type K+ transport system membrane component KefB